MMHVNHETMVGQREKKTRIARQGHGSHHSVINYYYRLYVCTYIAAPPTGHRQEFRGSTVGEQVGEREGDEANGWSLVEALL